jgi:hypothetical protein
LRRAGFQKDKGIECAGDNHPNWKSETKWLIWMEKKNRKVLLSLDFGGAFFGPGVLDRELVSAAGVQLGMGIFA